MIKERVEYIITELHGKPKFIGRSVNYKCCCQADSLEDLISKMEAMIKMWLKHGKEIMEQQQPLEMKQVTNEQWDERYNEWMVTSKWMRIANSFYDKINGIGGGKSMPFDEAVKLYEAITTRKTVKARLN